MKYLRKHVANPMSVFEKTCSAERSQQTAAMFLSRVVGSNKKKSAVSREQTAIPTMMHEQAASYPLHEISLSSMVFNGFHWFPPAFIDFS